MKTNEPDNRDDALRKVLKEWRTDIALPPRFQESVWQRIERTHASATPSMWDAVARWIGTMLPRPALAASYVTLLLVIGGAVGWTQAHQTNARVNNELGERYVHELDPYQAPRQ
jgi:hypothetical protein